MAKRETPSSEAVWSAKPLSAQELERKSELLSQRVRALAPSQTRTVADLVRALSGMSIQARNLGQCYEVLEAMLRDPDRPTILLGLAGPLIAGGLRQVIRELVEDAGMAVIVVEQHAKLALTLTRHAIVLERGRVVHRAPSEALLREPETLHRLVAVA